MMSTFHRHVRGLFATSGLLLLSACATLPASGPTAGEIMKAPRNAAGPRFRIVDVTAASVQAAAAAPSAPVATLANLAAPSRSDVVGPGDVLTIGIYEVGVSLFGTTSDSGLSNPSARGETLPAITVTSDGAITLPYIGHLAVAGRTTAEIQDMISRGLRGKSQSPQAVVAVRLNLSNTAIISGEVRRPGRIELSAQHERLLDAVALAGGTSYSPDDIVVRLTRADRSIEERLGSIAANSADNMVLSPGDRIEVLRRARSFIVLGATSKVAQVPFETSELSLGEAIARSGGPIDAQADPAAVFLFRYESSAAGGEAQPVIYKLNMLQPASYFLAQHFEMRDKDVIYIANAAANRPAKFVAIINQLFSPFVTARAISR